MKRIQGMPGTSPEPRGIPGVPWARPWDPQGCPSSPKVKCLKAAVTAWEFSLRSASCRREAPTASEASRASEARHARSEAMRFVTAN